MGSICCSPKKDVDPVPLTVGIDTQVLDEMILGLAL